MKKLLHIQLLPLVSGVQRFSLHLLDGLDKTEFEIYMAFQPGGELEGEVRKRGYHFLALPTFCHPISAKDMLTFVHLLWLFRRYRFDIVHTNSSKPGLLGRIAARLCHVPLIVHTMHGTAFQKGQPLLTYGFYALMELKGNLFGHKTVFVNNSDREKCLSMHLLPTVKARTIYNAIPHELTLQLNAVAEQRTMPDKQIIIGSTLRFSTQKNVIRLITVACKACRQEPKLKFIILGDGEHFALCQAIIKSYNVSNQVLLPGWDSDIVPWLKVFNAFVLYSRWEAQPFSIIEAMSSGLPVIGSAIPSIRELVDEDSGYLIALDDDASLEELFLSLAIDFQPAYRKGKQAVQRITELCDYNSMIDDYTAIYRG
ncbi:glycosyltransferase family 4 protein [Candidatus Cloacimonadota bacterium]